VNDAALLTGIELDFLGHGGMGRTLRKIFDVERKMVVFGLG
jgi:hypothetical protein